MFQPKNNFRVAPEYQAVWRELGLDAEGVFKDPRIKVWRSLEDRENCTFDQALPDGRRVRFHIKRYKPMIGFTTFAQDELRGYLAMAFEKVPTAPLVAFAKMLDHRSFVIFDDLAGYEPADKLVEKGLPFERLLEPTADLAALLHNRGLHHRDLYLCHFMAKPEPNWLEVKLIDVARVRRLGGIFTRGRWINKDLAQFWYSTTKLPVTDEQRTRWLARYAEQRGVKASKLLPGILRKVRAIAKHDVKLNLAQPNRNVSIPVK